MYKYILFDFDGTVFDTVEGITKSVQYALAKRGIEAELDSLRCFAGPPLVDMFMEMNPLIMLPIYIIGLDKLGKHKKKLE